ncbi:cellulose biosynthesis protein BcsD [Muricoccus aerilatus]|uniref:cellulose biosynthesis protein BcsD n=1 Tax=Muricoccus aerilatus TaxID=452982 RepID=UPI000693FF5B|nr:cellulose biosynthesis protein BcsD [Roseomonas aerilata]
MTAPSENGPSWGVFTRALLDTLEAHMQPEERAVLLRAIGTQIAALSPIPPEETLSGLEARMNERLAERRWGVVSISLDSNGPALVLTHEHLPMLPTGSDAAGAWIVPVLEGLHAGWISGQPGAEPELQPHVVSSGQGTATLRYGA